jgi:hypothetical protein
MLDVQSNMGDPMGSKRGTVNYYKQNDNEEQSKFIQELNTEKA